MLLNKELLLGQLKKPYLDTFTLAGIEGEFCIKNLSIGALLDLGEKEKQTKGKEKDSGTALFEQFNALICDETGTPLFDSQADFSASMPLWVAQKAIEQAMTRLQIGPDAIADSKKN
jgi:hypothetical protein